MADNPNKQTPINTKDFDNAQAALKLTEQTLANVEQRMQRLLLLQKSIQLKIIDPKDVVNFERFLNELANVDLSNFSEMKKMGGYLKDSNKHMGDLVDYASHLAKHNDKYSEGLVAQSNEYRQINSRIESQIKLRNKLNDSTETTVSLIDDIIKGFEEELDALDLTVGMQKKVQESFVKMKKSQFDNISLAETFTGTYQDFGDKLNNQISALGDIRPEISPIYEFDLLEDFQSKLREDMQKIISSAGQETVIIEGQVVDTTDKTKLFEGISKSFDIVSSKSQEILNGTIDALAEKTQNLFATEFNIKLSTDEALQLMTDLIKDQTELINGAPSILSPARQKEIENFYQLIQKSSDSALKTLIGYTISASGQIEAFREDVDKMNKQIQAVPKLDQIFKGAVAGSDELLRSLQYTVDGLMPRWLSSALNIDDAFQKIGDSTREGLQQMAADLANGSSKTEALSKFAGTFSTNLFKSLGVIGLITIAVTGLWKMMTSAGESVKEISKEFGVSSAMAYDMYKNILNMTAAIDNTTLKQEDVLDVLKKHRDEYGLILDLNNKANQEAVKFAGQLGKQYGMASGEAYGFTQQLQQLGADQKTSEEIAAVAAHASNLAGIPFNNVVKDLAESSEFVATMFAGYPQKAVAAATKIRAMGGSLKQVEKAMNKAFDMQSFMKGMTELTIMTQGAVDLSQYFTLATSGADAATQFKELTKQFDAMVASGQANVYNMRQFSEVTGLSSDELMRGNKIRRMQLDLGEDNVELLSKYLDKLSDADVADAKSAMNAAKKLSANEKLDAVWSSIKDTLMQAVLPLLEGISDLIVGLAPALKLFGAVIKGLVAPFKFIADLVSMIANVFTGDLKSAGDILKSMFEMPKGPLDLLLKAVQLFVAYWTGKKLISGLMNVWNTMKGISKTQRLMALGNMIPGGGMLKNIGSKAAGMIPGGGMVSNLAGKATSMLPKGASLGNLTKGLGAVTKNLGKIGGAAAGAFGAFSGYQQQKEKGGTTGEAVGAGAIRGGAALAGAAIGTAFGGPIGTMIGGFLGDTIGGWVVDNAPGLVKKVGGMFDKLGGKFSKLAEVWKPIFDKIVDALGTMWEKIGDAIGGIVDVFMSIWTAADNLLKALGISDGLAGAFGFLLETAIFPLMYVLDIVTTGIGNIVSAFTALGQLLTGDFSGALDTFTTMFSDTLDALIPDWFSSDDDTSKNTTDTSLAKAADAQVDQMAEMNKNLQESNDIASKSNDLLKGMTDGQQDQLKAAGYSDEIIKQLNEGTISMEDAISKQFSDLNLSSDQVSALANPKTTGEERDRIMQQAHGVPAPSLAVGTNLVKSDGLAMLHKGEAVVPATVAQGGFNMVDEQKIIPVKIVESRIEDTKIKQPDAVKGNFMNRLLNIPEDYQPSGFDDVETKQSSTGVGGFINKLFNVPEELKTVSEPKINKTITPVQNQLTDIQDSATQAQQYENQMSYPQQASRPTSQDPMLKQLLVAMQDVANRPVVVEIGGVELRSLNKRMKTLNS